MGINIDSIINELYLDEKLINLFNTYDKYINFRFDYAIRTNLTHIPEEFNYNIDYSKFDPSKNILLGCIDSTNDTHDVIKLRDELKTLTTEVNLKRKEISMMNINEEGLKKNIKHLEEIISIKEDFINDIVNYAEIKYNAKEKLQKDFYKANKKYHKVLSQLEKSNKAMKSGSSNATKKQKQLSEELNEKALRYETKVKKMGDIIRIAGDSNEKLMQYQIALQTSKDRLKLFNEQLNNQCKIKHEITLLLKQHDKRIDKLKMLLSKLGVFSSIEKSRNHTSSNMIEKGDLKKDFIELQNMRNKVLSTRPVGMFNPKYQKENSLTKAEIRRYLENDEVIDSIDYLIEVKNNEVGCSKKNLSKYIKSDTNEASVFLKCLLTLSKNDIQQLLIHYFVKVVDIKESERENDELIAKLDGLTDKQKHTIITLNNNYQEFHLSIEKKFTSLKKFYQDKMNSLFEILQEETNAMSAYKMRQEISSLKKKINELEKLLIAKPKEIFVMPEPQISIDTSKSGSETVSSAKVTYHKNKLKIQKNRSKFF